MKPRQKEPRAGTARAQILALLALYGPMQRKEIADAIGRDTNSLGHDFAAMVRKGLLKRQSRGLWSIA